MQLLEQELEPNFLFCEGGVITLSARQCLVLSFFLPSRVQLIFNYFLQASLGNSRYSLTHIGAWFLLPHLISYSLETKVVS